MRRAMGLGAFRTALLDGGSPFNSSLLASALVAGYSIWAAPQLGFDLAELGPEAVEVATMNMDTARFDEVLARTKRLFKKTKAIRPKGSRAGSMELYLVGLERRPRTE